MNSSSKNFALGFQASYSEVAPTTIISHKYLSVDEDDRSEESPGAALPVDVEHAQDLEEADAADGRGGEDLPVRTHRQHHDRRRHHDQVCKCQ